MSHRQWFGSPESVRSDPVPRGVQPAPAVLGLSYVPPWTRRAHPFNNSPLRALPTLSAQMRGFRRRREAEIKDTSWSKYSIWRNLYKLQRWKLKEWEALFPVICCLWRHLQRLSWCSATTTPDFSSASVTLTEFQPFLVFLNGRANLQNIYFRRFMISDSKGACPKYVATLFIGKLQ